MLYSYRSWRYSTKCFRALLCLILCSFAIGLAFAILAGPTDDAWMEEDGPAVEYASSAIFCFVLTENRHHASSAQAIVRTWGKRCDRFYFVTRLQNTSISLMMLEHFENITDITPETITRYTLDVLTFLDSEPTFTSYQWFLRASDESFVIIPNLRRLVAQFQIQQYEYPLAYVGDVQDMHDKYQLATSGSVMLFNRRALRVFVAANSKDSDEDVERRCPTTMIYDHEFVVCMKRIGIRVNPVKNNLILSQNLSTYKSDERFKVTSRQVERTTV